MDLTPLKLCEKILQLIRYRGYKKRLITYVRYGKLYTNSEIGWIYTLEDIDGGYFEFEESDLELDQYRRIKTSMFSEKDKSE